MERNVVVAFVTMKYLTYRTKETDETITQIQR
jgi:hypothetical protein